MRIPLQVDKIRDPCATPLRPPPSRSPLHHASRGPPPPVAPLRGRSTVDKRDRPSVNLNPTQEPAHEDPRRRRL